MVWLKTLLFMLPIVSGQIIFPGELGWSVSKTNATSTTDVSVISSSIHPLVTSPAPPTFVFTSSLISPFSVLTTTSPVSSISFNLSDVVLTIPGLASKASTTPVLKPTPVTSEPEISTASKMQPPKRLFPDSLHPEVPKSGPVIPTPINVMQIAPSRFPGQFPPLDLEHELQDETTVSTNLLFTASIIESTPVVPTPFSPMQAKTTTGIPQPEEFTEFPASSSTPSHQRESFNSGQSSHEEEESHHEESTKPGNFSLSEDSSHPEYPLHHEESSHSEDSIHHDKPLNPEDSLHPKKPSDLDDSSHHGESPNSEEASQPDKTLHLIGSSNPGASFTTDKTVTSESLQTTTLDPQIIDQKLTNAFITLVDAEDVDVNNKNKTCLTPLGEKGTCVVFKDCEGYSSLTDHMDNKTVMRFLRSRVCKLLPRAILFCCPKVKPVLPLGF